jgi:hypothetical protein
MPEPLKSKLEHEYSDMPKEKREHAVYGTLNKLGYMKGSKETKKGKAMERALEKKKKNK